MPESRPKWREPASRLPLRWGSYTARYAAGVALIFAGGALVQLTSAYSLVVLPLGLFAHTTGWCILPGVGWRRILGAGIGALTTIVLLNGAPATVFLVFPFAAWLLLRQRPLVSYLTVVVPLLVAAVLSQTFPDYGWGVVVLSISGAALTGAAWLARSLAAMSGRSTVISG
ncbi:MAG: hypothetical protein J0H56_05210 [Micrococcales bacterium]|nr:hypothetical protein [Micrococcales bacterium]